MLFLLISLAAWVSVLVLVVASCLLAAEGEHPGGVGDCAPHDGLAPVRGCERRARRGVQRLRARPGHSHSGARQLRAFPGR